MNWNCKPTVWGTGLSGNVCGCVSLSLPVPSFPGRPPGHPAPQGGGWEAGEVCHKQMCFLGVSEKV